jgi:DNA-binding beta-propeller fold protein YncE
VLDAAGAEIPNVAISYTSSAPQIVSVSATGLLTTTAATGSATITGRLEQLTATMTVNVVQSAHPQGNIVSSSPASGYGAAITSSGDFYVTGLNGTPVRGKLPDYTTLTSMTAVQAGLAVVANRAGNALFFAGVDDVVAFDPVQYQVRWTAATGKGTPFDVVLSNDESTVFLTTGNSVVVAIDATTGAVKWELAPGYTAVHLAVNPSRNVLYASGPDMSAVAEIDLTTRTVVFIPVPGGSPQDVVVSPDGGELYVALQAGGLAFVNTSTRTATALVTPQCAGYGLIMTPDTEQLWIGCSLSGSITVVNRQSRTVLQTINVGDVRRLAISSDGTTVLASGQSKITFIR